MFDMQAILEVLQHNGVDITMEVLNDLVPFCLAEIRNYTRQWFLTSQHVSDTLIVEGNTITFNKSHTFGEGDVIEFLNSERNRNLYIIESVTEHSITVIQPLVKETLNDTIILLSFRGFGLMTLVNMIAYDVSNVVSAHIKSQTLNGYSVTYGDTVSKSGVALRYPVNLYGSVNHLRKLDDDYMEYYRFGYSKKVGGGRIAFI